LPRLWSVELSSDFPTGAGIQLRSPEPGVVTFLAPWDESPCPMWFHFRIRGARGWRVRFVLKNARNCLGSEKHYAELRVRPVITEDPPTVPPRRRRWRRIPKSALSYDETSGAFSFEAKINSNEAYVAHCYPHSLNELRWFLKEFGRCPFLKAGTAGKTERGRSMPLLRISEGSARGKMRIYLMARHHSGETPGSWALEGTLRWLLSRDRRAAELRRRFVFCVVPFVDLDGCEEGLYGKERAPVDFNRAYMEDSPRVEVQHILREIFRRRRNNLILLDYHAPSAGDPNHIFIKSEPFCSARYSKIAREFGEILSELSPRGARLLPKQISMPTYMRDEAEVTSTGAAYLAHGMLAATMEVSYGCTADGRFMQLEDYLDYGAAIGKALHTLLSVRAPEELIEHERDRKPFPEYDGCEFAGGLQWVPAKDASLSIRSDAGGEVLVVKNSAESSRCLLAMPRTALQGGRRLALRWRVESRRKKTDLSALVTVFYYGASGLRLARQDKIKLPFAGTNRWRALRLKLHPPSGARMLRASFDISGGRTLMELRRPTVSR